MHCFPFLPNYSKKIDAPIITGATAVDLKNGLTVALIFGQGLWFEDRIEKSLLKPNQFRHNGIPVCDDPTDNYCDIELAINDKIFIQMGMEVITCGSGSGCPTLEEMASCKRITVSHKTDWDPSAVHFNVSSVNKDNRYTVHDVSQFEVF